MAIAVMRWFFYDRIFAINFKQTTNVEDFFIRK